jgi:hypothetical protein
MHLCLLVEVNLRKVLKWNLVVRTIQSRVDWASISIFYLSYLKLSVKIRKTIVRIQRHFLWGGACGSPYNENSWYVIKNKKINFNKCGSTKFTLKEQVNYGTFDKVTVEIIIEMEFIMKINFVCSVWSGGSGSTQFQ